MSVRTVEDCDGPLQPGPVYRILGLELGVMYGYPGVDMHGLCTDVGSMDTIKAQRIRDTPRFAFFI